MQSTKSIPKIRLLSVILCLIFISTFILNTLNVHAADDVLVEGHSADSDVTSSDGKWYSTYCAGAGYQGQGVLIYLIERNTFQPVAGTSPKAFACSSNMLGYELHAQDKFNKYPEVTTWERNPNGTGKLPYWAGEAGTAQGGGLIRSSTKSNLDQIKAWLSKESDSGNSTQGIWLVQTLWQNDSVTTRFRNEELILIVEPIIANVFAQYIDTGFTEEVANSHSIDDLISAIDGFKHYVSLYNSSTKMSVDLSTALTYWKVSLTNAKNSGNNSAMYACFQGTKQAILSTPIGDKVYTKNYIGVNPPVYCGTPKRIIDFYNSYVPQFSLGLTWTKTQAGVQYYRRAAHQAAYIDTNTIVCAGTIPAANLWPAGSSVKKLHTDSDIRNKTIGMLAMLAWHSDGPGSSSQTTCDESVDPVPHPAPPESSGDCSIIKTYRIKQADGSIVHVDTFVKDLLHNEILIEDESEYKVVAWKVGSVKTPSINGYNWDSCNIGIRQTSGTEPSIVTLNSPTYKYLYVLLEKDLGNMNINANYNLSQSSITRHISINNPDQEIVSGVALKSIASIQFKWTIPAHNLAKSCGGHAYNYRSCGQQHAYNCGQSKYCMSGGVKVPCGDTNGDGSVGAGDSVCGGHACGADAKHPQCSALCSNNTCIHDTDYCTWGEWKDTSLTMALKNIALSNGNNSYVVATNGHQHVTYNGTNDAFSHSVTRTSASAQSYTISGLDYHTLIHRGYTQIVIAQWKDTGTDFLDTVSSTSYTIANSIPASRPNRKNTDYKASFTVQIGDSSSDKNTSRGPSAKAPHSNAQCSNENTTLSLTANSVAIEPSVQVNVYLGSGNVVHDTSCPSSDYSKTTGNSSGNTIISGHATKSGSLTNFRPYVQMKYDTLYSYDNKAYVLGEIDRSLTFNSYAELEWTKFNNPNLTINSLQWSTHNEANQHHLSGTVLPGGATLSLSVSTSNTQIVKVRTFQPILAGDGLTQVNSAGGTASFADINMITQSHAEYAETVRANLDKVHIQQYASTTDYGLDVMNNTRANKTDVIDNENNKVENGVPTADGIGGSNEDKYYFKNDSANGTNSSSAEGDLDATISGTSVYYVTFWCDSAGNIRVNKSNTLAGASSISGLVANESDVSTDSNIVARRVIGETGMCWVNGTYTSLAKEFDEKTKVVTKLFLGLEKGGGSDFSAPWTSDGGWYNEAFDGITYVVYTSDIKVTFATPSERITVLDPKLCPESTSKSNLFSDFHTSQFKLEKNATSQSNQVVGSYRDPKTGDTTNIKMPGLDMLYWSREFYVPNVTTQDLN